MRETHLQTASFKLRHYRPDSTFRNQFRSFYSPVSLTESRRGFQSIGQSAQAWRVASRSAAARPDGGAVGTQCGREALLALAALIRDMEPPILSSRHS